jgi:hypothetical protein
MTDQDKTEGFAAPSALVPAETASSAVAAQAQALVQARYIMAMQRPRDIDDVRVKLLKECHRPGFAKAAWYNKPVGKGVKGPSIRFMEAAMRCMTNVGSEVAVLYDDPEKRILRVTVTDYETNVPFQRDIVVSKVVERRKLRDGQVPISKRRNAQGDLVYLVEASEDDLLNKEGALVSKAMRTCGLRHVPGDLQDECEAVIKEVLAKEVAEDPDKYRNQIADAFAELGIKPSQLAAYIGHALEAATPADISELQILYATVRDGEGTFEDALELRTGKPTAEGGEQPDPKREALRAKLEATRKARQEAAAKAKASEAEGQDRPPEQPDPDTPADQETAASESPADVGDPMDDCAQGNHSFEPSDEAGVSGFCVVCGEIQATIEAEATK